MLVVVPAITLVSERTFVTVFGTTYLVMAFVCVELRTRVAFPPV